MCQGQGGFIASTILAEPKGLFTPGLLKMKNIDYILDGVWLLRLFLLYNRDKTTFDLKISSFEFNFSFLLWQGYHFK